MLLLIVGEWPVNSHIRAEVIWSQEGYFLKTEGQKVNVTLWRDASCKTLKTGDDVSVLDGRATQFAGTPILNAQIGADINVC